MSLKTAKYNGEKRNNIKRQEVGGREIMVLPVVMIVEGVLNGALLLREHFAKYPAAWDGRPVVVRHPDIDGESVSASDPAVYYAEGAARVRVGSLHNTRLDGDKLRSEAWVDVEAACEAGLCSWLDRIEAGEVMEVSTGYFSDDAEMVGEWNGVKHEFVHENIAPDHLALLPDETGACSVKDGCGVRTNKRDGKKSVSVLTKMMRAYRSKREANKAMKNKRKQMEIRLNKMRKALTGLRKNDNVDAELVETIIDLDDEQLEQVVAIADAMLAAAGPVDDGGEGGDDGAGDVEENDDDEGKGGEFVRPEDVARIVENALRRNSEQAALIDDLLGRPGMNLSRDDLATMSAKQLKVMCKAYPAGGADRDFVAQDYSGRSAPVNHARDDGKSAVLGIGGGLRANANKRKEQK